MPRLELCAAVTGAQLAKLLEKELNLKNQPDHPVNRFHNRADVAAVLLLQKLKDLCAWRYVDL